MHMRSISCVAPPLMPVESAEPLAGGNALADGLKLLNSLSQKTEPFKPIDPRLVKWYVCGPTVYDSAHVGHARNYVAFDIVRRILSDYFGFDILYVMNITDIDDKIILRTHRIHLEALVDQLAAVDCTTTLSAARGAAEAVLAAAKPELSELIEAQRQLTAAAAANGIELAGECAIKEEFLQLTSAFEVEFFDDLAALNVLQPDAITRVSDYLPEIIAYIERILENGYCYESNGSVYFDTNAFANAPNMTYGKLDPSKVNLSPSEDDTAAETDDWTEGKSTAELLAEGEGALSAAAVAEKRHPADFVLWKASKLGEPAWPSPWGDGRPGWHIECSAMASDMLGDRVDLNSGGVDLKFPHHENQIAQAEAHFNCCSWVNYFLHSGHLKIEGLKMSKSLKNFITIRGALEHYSSAQLRFLFLLRRFSEPMEYSENTLAAAADLERRFATFGTALGARLKDAASLNAAGPGPAAAVRTAGAGGPPVPARAAIHKWGEEERKLHGVFVDRRAAVHAALLDSIDTPTALKALEQLIRATNVYMAEVSDVGRGATLLARVQRYFTSMMSTFGVTPAASASAATTTGGASAEQVVDALSAFRDGIRQRAIDRIRAKPKGGGAEGGGDDAGGEADGKAVAQQILEACDELRDEVLPSLGIQLDDRPSGAAQITFGDPKLLQAEAARKAEQAAELAAAKAAKAAAKEAAKAKEAALAMIPPTAMFAAEHDAAFEREGPSYTKLDDNGLPTETDDGELVSKSMRKKLIKQQTKHAKLHAAFLEKQSST